MAPIDDARQPVAAGDKDGASGSPAIAVRTSSALAQRRAPVLLVEPQHIAFCLRRARPSMKGERPGLTTHHMVDVAHPDPGFLIKLACHRPFQRLSRLDKPGQRGIKPGKRDWRPISRPSCSASMMTTRSTRGNAQPLHPPHRLAHLRNGSVRAPHTAQNPCRACQSGTSRAQP